MPLILRAPRWALLTAAAFALNACRWLESPQVDTGVRQTDYSESDCIDRDDLATSFPHVAAWEMQPESVLPPRSQVRLAVLTRSIELSRLPVPRHSCRNQTVQVTRIGSVESGLPASANPLPTVVAQFAATRAHRASSAPTPVSRPAHSVSGLGTQTSTNSDVVSVPATKLQFKDLTASVSTTKSLASYNWIWSLECAGEVMGANAVPESGFYGPVNGGSAQELRFGKVADPFDRKRRVLMFKANRSDRHVAGAPRCELGFSPTQAGKLPLGQELWFAFGIHLPAWQASPDAQIVAQWHVSNTTTVLNPLLALIVKGSDLFVEARYNANASPTIATTSTPINLRSAGLPTTRWTYFVVHAKISTDSQQGPFLRIWRDGRQLVNYAGPLGYNIPGHVPYGKLGHYHWMTSRNPWPESLPTRTVLMRSPIFVWDPNRVYSASDLLGYVMIN